MSPSNSIFGEFSRQINGIPEQIGVIASIKSPFKFIEVGSSSFPYRSIRCIPRLGCYKTSQRLENAQGV